MASNAKPLFSLTSTDRERFWSKVDVLSTDQCWLWKAALSCGYGVFNVGKYDLYRSHRLSYYFTYGEDPGSLLVCHKCDNPPCCNPHHLFLGTQQDNVTDRMLKGRYQSGEEHWTHRLPDRVSRGDDRWQRKHPERTPRGSAVGSAKLNESQVSIIRKKLSTGIAGTLIAKEFSISESIVSAIRKGKIWKHVT